LDLSGLTAAVEKDDDLRGLMLLQAPFGFEQRLSCPMWVKTGPDDPEM